MTSYSFLKSEYFSAWCHLSSLRMIWYQTGYHQVLPHVYLLQQIWQRSLLAGLTRWLILSALLHVMSKWDRMRWFCYLYLIAWQRTSISIDLWLKKTLDLLLLFSWMDYSINTVTVLKLRYPFLWYQFIYPLN